jgi:tetratricopeptide (TPR) repeat protein
LKSLSKYCLALVLALCLAGIVMAQGKARKLPESAYIKSARIAIGYGETGTLDQFTAANAMLDSLFMYYGPVAEGLYLKVVIQKDMIDKAPNLMAKREVVRKLAAYRDSLKMCCQSQTIKPKYRDGCNKYIPTIDSLAALNWRVFWNDGVGQANRVDEAVKVLETEKDSLARDFTQKKLDASIDSSIQNMNLAVILDSADFRPYVALSTLYRQKKDFDSSRIWMNKAIPLAKDPAPLLIQTAYDFIQQNKYSEAVPYFKKYLALVPNDTTNWFNLAVCYNNSKQYDSAQGVYHQMLALDPSNAEALVGIGRFYNQLARYAADSSKAYEAANNAAEAKKWTAAQNDAFDSSQVYFKRAFENNKDDKFAAEEYGVVAYIRGNYEAAAIPFKRLTELDSLNSSAWTSLGDTYLNLKQFKEATAAYEKVVQIDPSDRQIWQRLSDLYKENGQTAKQTEAEKHLK